MIKKPHKLNVKLNLWDKSREIGEKINSFIVWVQIFYSYYTKKTLNEVYKLLINEKAWWTRCAIH